MATVCQAVFARNWPLKAWLLFGAIVGAVLTGRACEPTLSMLGHLWISALFSGSIAVGSVVGVFCAVALAPVILPPLYHLRAIRNGAPFQEGDYVHVLVAPYQDVIARVYEIWTDRNQLRIELGADAKRAVEDVFSFVEVCRVANADQSNALEPAARSVAIEDSSPLAR